ncbi:hypothetical protein A4X20_01645 [Mycolicibacterium iranicum]|uniref:4Fe-4S Wbl-type domain-containing protein n=2 Tax=Mycolicibacterium iranicum TaxID=912594 RepID=A0A178M5H3_MYCIR|nr:hypothetical protein A4X20_01645 [Mycolicibacterium iranicum]
MFFASETYQGARRVAWEEDVKKICLQCEVQGTCLAHALKSSERHGIWGATTPAERARMVRDGLRSPRRRIG